MADDSPEFFDPAEDCPLRSPREIFADFGYSPTAPTELDDCQLPGRLWELLYAAAGRRIFFYNSNHLSDREFCTMLWNQWLDESTADVPLKAETNTNLFMSEFDTSGMTHEGIYLRYYADEADRDLWRSSDPDFAFPSHENPPHDRDRFLPTPPLPLEAHAGWLPGDDEPQDNKDDNPRGLAEMDQDTSGTWTEATLEAPASEKIDSALEAQFRASEPDNWTPPADNLAEESVPLLPPAESTDETLTPILWELLHNLALRGFYLLHSDHLSDRDLYAELWHHGLREPAFLPGRNPRGGWFHDFLGSWGDDETRLWLRYFAIDEERAKHAAQLPKDEIPPKERPPFNRDWRLPKGPF